MRFLSIAVLLFFLNGCSEKEQPGIKNTSQVKVSTADLEQVQQIIQNRNGKILFVNVWATWCIPCIEEFPDLVRIYNEYKDKDFEFLSLSADFGDNADSLVRSFMTSQQAVFPVYIIEERSSQAVINFLNKEWSGAIPVTFIYDVNSDQKKFILGAQTYAGFKQSIDSILIL